MVAAKYEILTMKSINKKQQQKNILNGPTDSFHFLWTLRENHLFFRNITKSPKVEGSNTRLNV